MRDGERTINVAKGKSEALRAAAGGDEITLSPNRKDTGKTYLSFKAADTFNLT